MHKNEFVTHACEQVLRFTTLTKWDDLTEARKVQLAFNLGVASLGLDINKETGYDYLTRAQRSEITMTEFHQHTRALVAEKQVAITEASVSKPH
jgi:hypothetical protein